LFFNYRSKTPLTPEYVKKYSDSLEMVRLAPSSGILNPGEYFLMKYEWISFLLKNQ